MGNVVNINDFLYEKCVKLAAENQRKNPPRNVRACPPSYLTIYRVRDGERLWFTAGYESDAEDFAKADTEDEIMKLVEAEFDALGLTCLEIREEYLDFSVA